MASEDSGKEEGKNEMGIYSIISQMQEYTEKRERENLQDIKNHTTEHINCEQV